MGFFPDSDDGSDRLDDGAVPDHAPAWVGGIAVHVLDIKRE